jgi:hypothetical protein
MKKKISMGYSEGHYIFFGGGGSGWAEIYVSEGSRDPSCSCSWCREARSKAEESDVR